MYNKVAGAVDFDYVLFVEPYTYLYPTYLRLVSNLHLKGKCSAAFGSSVLFDYTTLINFDLNLYDFQIGLDIKDSGDTNNYYDLNSDAGALYRTLLINREVFMESSKFPIDFNGNFLRYVQLVNNVTSGVYYINEVSSAHIKGIL